MPQINLQAGLQSHHTENKLGHAQVKARLPEVLFYQEEFTALSKNTNYL